MALGQSSRNGRLLRAGRQTVKGFIEATLAVMAWLGISTLAAASWFLFRQQEHDEYDEDSVRPETTPPDDPEG
jgi:hypothetical protein